MVMGLVRASRVAALTAASVLLGGCSLFGTNLDPVLTYRLQGDPDALPRASGDTPCCLLEVRTPLPAPGFATARMIYERNAYQNEAFAYAEWVDTLPTMVLASMIEAFDTSGYFDNVVAAPSPARADYRLESRQLKVLQRFDADQSEVVVSLRVRLVSVDERTLLGAERFEVVVPAAPANPKGGVDAANEAFGQLLGELVAYVSDLTGS